MYYHPSAGESQPATSDLDLLIDLSPRTNPPFQLDLEPFEVQPTRYILLPPEIGSLGLEVFGEYLEVLWSRKREALVKADQLTTNRLSAQSAHRVVLAQHPSKENL